MNDLLFPRSVPTRQWIEIPAKGFQKTAAALIYRASEPAMCGMPLGGIGTGCIDLETDGTLGYSTIFNSLWPRAGPLNLPFLGLSIGQENWILSTKRLKSAVEGTPDTINARRGKSVEEILYWGHYPVADLEYITDCPLQIALRAWAPFIPGDLFVSNIPCCVFSLLLKNPSKIPLDGSIVFSFPGPSPWEVESSLNFNHQKIMLESRSDPDHKPIVLSGVSVSHSGGINYVIGVVNHENFFIGGGIGLDGGAWSRIGGASWLNKNYGRAYELPPTNGQADASILVPINLNMGEIHEVTFILTWFAPKWNSGGRPDAGGNEFFHYYGHSFGSAMEIARWISANHQEVLKRILRWQQEVYAENNLPIWLRESLVNMLHLITECGVWAQAKSPIGSWCHTKDGLFAFNECPRGCPQMECIPCSFYGNFPLIYFFPELALSTLRGYKAYQFKDGQIPWIFGGCTDPLRTPPFELTMPSRGYAKKPQTALDGSCYASMVDRFLMSIVAREKIAGKNQSASQDLIIEEFYQSLKQNLVFTMSLRPEAETGSIIMAPSGDNFQDWFEGVKLGGIIPHVGGIHLAHLKIMERLAERMHDTKFSDECQKMFIRGKDLLEKDAWQGDNYYLYVNPIDQVKNKTILAYQLDGEWIARMHGLGPVFNQERIKKTLETIKKTNITPNGARVFNPNSETDYSYSYWGENGMHVGGTLMLAMLYLYEGEIEFGLELARRTLHVIEVINGCSWDSPIVISCDTGQVKYGNDYYQNLILWTLPAAIARVDCATLCREGGFIDRVLKAGN